MGNVSNIRTCWSIIKVPQPFPDHIHVRSISKLLAGRPALPLRSSPEFSHQVDPVVEEHDGAVDGREAESHHGRRDVPYEDHKQRHGSDHNSAELVQSQAEPQGGEPELKVRRAVAVQQLLESAGRTSMK